MKLSLPFKRFLTATLLALYGTGAAVWLLHSFFQRDRGFGPEPSEFAPYYLKAHGVVGLLFFLALGALLQSHVPKGWRARRFRGSGASLLAAAIFLSGTVPMLYYVGNETWRGYAVLGHTYVGLLAIVPYFLHLAFVRRERR